MTYTKVAYKKVRRQWDEIVSVNHNKCSIKPKLELHDSKTPPFSRFPYHSDVPVSFNKEVRSDTLCGQEFQTINLLWC